VHQSCYRRGLDAVERSKLPSSRVPMDLFGFFKASDSVHCIQYSQDFVASSAMCQGPLDSLLVRFASVFRAMVSVGPSWMFAQSGICCVAAVFFNPTMSLALSNSG
jgi:hypothetical protein